MNGTKEDTCVMIKEAFVDVNGKDSIDGEYGHEKHICGCAHKLLHFLSLIKR